MNIKKMLKFLGKKLKAFFNDEYGGNLLEYALLVGFALFLFFIIVSVITSMLDWTLTQSNDFLGLFDF